MAHQGAEPGFPERIHVGFVLAEEQQILGQDLGVGRGLEGGARFGQFDPDLCGVDDVAVVRNRHLFTGQWIIEQDRLRVAEPAGAGRRVSCVPDGSDALELRGGLLVKHLGDQTHASFDGQTAAIGRTDAGALLAAMLQRVDAVEGFDGDIDFRRPDPEDATCFARAVVDFA